MNIDRNRLTWLLREEPFPVSLKYDTATVLNKRTGPGVFYLTRRCRSDA